MTSGMKVIHERAILFAKQNGEACFAYASELVNARNLQDVVGIQSGYAQSQMQAYAGTPILVADRLDYARMNQSISEMPDLARAIRRILFR
jgi:hypothetical protein